MSRRLPADTRFIIVGAGVAGLSAARTLWGLGYRRITVIEAGEQPGGKCLTVQIDNVDVDLGAVFCSAIDYRDLFRLARSHGLGTRPIAMEYVDLQRGPLPPLSARQKLRLAWEFATYIRLQLWGWGGIRRLDLTRLHPELLKSFSEAFEHQGLGMLGRRMGNLLTASGYCYPEQLPLAYVVTYANPQTLWGIFWEPIYIWEGGAQQLWLREAAALRERGVSFRLGARATAVERGQGVAVTTDRGGEPIRGDQLIVACDPREIGLDPSPAECELFAAIRHEDYRVLLCRIAGLPPITLPTLVSIPENMRSDRPGRPMAIFRYDPASDLCAAYAFGGRPDDATLPGKLEEDVARLGGRVTAHLDTKIWPRYFPHFDLAGLRAGAPDALRAIQGAQRTTYVGEWATFATIARTAAFASRTVAQLTEGRLASLRPQSLAGASGALP